jgi:hypothetical protein
MSPDLTEIGSAKSARKAFGQEFKRMHDDMLVKKQSGEPGLELVPEKFMAYLTGEVPTIVNFASQKDEAIQQELQDMFDNQFVLQLIMLTNSRKNIFSLEQLHTIRETAREMVHQNPYFSQSAANMENAVQRYAETFNIKLLEE